MEKKLNSIDLTNEKSLVIKIRGGIQESTLPEYRDFWEGKLKQLNRTLSTEQDFEEAAGQIKILAAVRQELINAKESAIKETSTVNALFEEIDSLVESISNVEGSLFDQIKAEKKRQELEKEKNKQEIINNGIKSARSLYSKYSEETPEIALVFNFSPEGIQKAAKGKRKPETMQEAVDKEISDYENSLSNLAKSIEAKKAIISSAGSEFSMLFNDKSFLFSMPETVLRETVLNRVEAHKLKLKVAESERQKKAESENKKQPEGLSSSDVVTDSGQTLIKESASISEEVKFEKDSNTALPPEPKETHEPTSQPEPIKKHGVYPRKKESFTVSILLSCSTEEAVELAKKVKSFTSGFPQVQDVKLKVN